MMLKVVVATIAFVALVNGQPLTPGTLRWNGIMGRKNTDPSDLPPNRQKDWSQMSLEMPSQISSNMPQIQACICDSQFRAGEAAELIRHMETFEQCQARKCGYCINYMEWMGDKVIQTEFVKPPFDDVCYNLGPPENGPAADCNNIRTEINNLPEWLQGPSSNSDGSKDAGPWMRIRQALKFFEPMRNQSPTGSFNSRKSSQGACFMMACCPEPRDDPQKVFRKPTEDLTYFGADSHHDEDLDPQQ